MKNPKTNKTGDSETFTRHGITSGLYVYLEPENSKYDFHSHGYTCFQLAIDFRNINEKISYQSMMNDELMYWSGEGLIYINSVNVE